MNIKNIIFLQSNKRDIKVSNTSFHQLNFAICKTNVKYRATLKCLGSHHVNKHLNDQNSAIQILFLER